MFDIQDDDCEAPTILLNGLVHFWNFSKRRQFMSKLSSSASAYEYIVFHDDIMDRYDGPFSLDGVKLVLWKTFDNSQLNVYHFAKLYKLESRIALQEALSPFFPNHRLLQYDGSLVYKVCN